MNNIRESISAKIFITSDKGDREYSEKMFSSEYSGGLLAGHAEAYFPSERNNETEVVFYLFMGEDQLQQTIEQLGRIAGETINLVINIAELEYEGYSDTRIWNATKNGSPNNHLPITNYSIHIPKIRTTQKDIRSAEEIYEYKMMAESADASDQKSAQEWMKESAKERAAKELEPSLVLLRYCRALLAFIMIVTLFMATRSA